MLPPSLHSYRLNLLEYMGNPGRKIQKPIKHLPQDTEQNQTQQKQK